MFVFLSHNPRRPSASGSPRLGSVSGRRSYSATPYRERSDLLPERAGSYSGASGSRVRRWSSASSLSGGARLRIHESTSGW
jgi:hypothetical protein